VAVKIITGKSFGNQKALRRFEREARASAKLNHPNRLSGGSLEETRLNEALQKCLAKSRRERFATIAELQATLIPAIRACTQLLGKDKSSTVDKLSYSSSEETIRF
jgi:hypothetical protein